MKFLLSLLFVVGVASTSLTDKNWAAETAGKTIFVKFFAPWCGHCQSMAADWSKLMTEFKDHPKILVAEADCDGDGKALCDTQGVEGFPTIKSGSPDSLEDYSGERDFASMKEHAATLKPSCTPSNLDVCTPEEKTELEGFMKMNKEDLEKAIDAAHAPMKAAEKEFDDGVNALQTQYDELEKTKNAKIAEAEKGGFKNMKKVYFHLHPDAENKWADADAAAEGEGMGEGEGEGDGMEDDGMGEEGEDTEGDAEGMDMPEDEEGADGAEGAEGDAPEADAPKTEL